MYKLKPSFGSLRTAGAQIMMIMMMMMIMGWWWRRRRWLPNYSRQGVTAYRDKTHKLRNDTFPNSGDVARLHVMFIAHVPTSFSRRTSIHTFPATMSNSSRVYPTVLSTTPRGSRTFRSALMQRLHGRVHEQIRGDDPRSQSFVSKGSQTWPCRQLILSHRVRSDMSLWVNKQVPFDT